MDKANAIGAIAAAMMAAGCNSTGRAEEAGAATSRTYQVAAFEKIEVAGPYEVTVTTGGAPSVRAEGGAKAIERMVVEVRDGKLLIHPRKRKGLTLGFMTGNRDTVRLAVTVPALAGAEIAGSGGVTVDRVAGDSFSGGIAGSGRMTLGQVDVKRLEMDIAGSGEIRAGRGRAAVADYEIAGSGDIDAAGLVADVAGVSIAGSGNVRAQATGTAAVDIAGSGNVELSGGAKCTVSKAGSGNVRCS